MFSYRQSVEGQLRVDYEHLPRRVPELEKLIHNAENTGVWIDDNGRTVLDRLSWKVMDEFFRDFLSAKDHAYSNAESRRRKSNPELTLGVVIAADREKLIPKHNEITGEVRSKASLEDDIRTVRLLCEKEGCTKWRDVTVEHCGNWLSKESLRMRKSCARIMKRLLLPFFNLQMIDDLLGWESYHPEKANNHQQNYKGLVRKNILPNMLSYGQCRQLLEKFISNDYTKAVSGVDMALVLKLTLGLDTEEICALKKKSFIILRDFPERLALCITHQYCKAVDGKNYRIRDIDDTYQLRILPLSRLAKRCFEEICARRTWTDETPLVPHKTNSNRHMSPEDLDKELSKRVLELFPNNRFSIDDIRLSAAHVLLETTAVQELRKSGCEEEELRFILGKRPLLVSAVSYADYLNEAELNKLGALQDSWLNKVITIEPHAETAEVLHKKDAEINWITPSFGCRTQVAFKISFTAKDAGEIPEDGITLELHAPHGFSGIIVWEDGKD